MSNAREVFSVEVLRQGELLLQAQLELATAADQRSMTLLGITAGGAVAMLAASASLFAADGGTNSLPVALMVASVPLLVSAVLAIRATRPVGFAVPGTRANLLLPSSDFPIDQVRLELAMRYQERVSFNESILARNGQRVATALKFVIGSIPVGVLAYVTCLYAGW